MKKSNMSLQTIFILFISIVVFALLIMMFIKWTKSSSKFVDMLAKKDEMGNLKPQEITSSAGSYASDIADRAVVCYNYGSKGKVDGNLCYTVSCDSCSASATEIENEINNRIPDGKYEISASISSKAVISYEQNNNNEYIVKIE